MVVVGIGVVPEVGWLDGSGLSIDNGVVCDEALFAADRVVAAGDVARWHHPSSGGLLRVEHWTNAAEGGAAAARNLLAGSADAVAYDPVPFFWSDQYDTKIQVIGLPGPDDEVVVVEGSVGRGQAGGALPRAATGSRPCWPSTRPAGSCPTGRCWPPGPRSTRRWRCPGPGRERLRPAAGRRRTVRNRRVKARASAIWSAEGSIPP